MSSRRNDLTPIAAKSPKGRAWVIGAAIVVGLVLVAAVALWGLRGNGSEPGPSTDEVSARDAITTMVERYNDGDIEYIKSNSCGELYARASSDTLGGLLDTGEINGPGTARAETSVDDFHYFTRIGDYSQIYSKVELTTDGTESDHIGTFTLEQQNNAAWKICTAFLISASAG